MRLSGGRCAVCAALTGETVRWEHAVLWCCARCAASLGPAARDALDARARATVPSSQRALSAVAAYDTIPSSTSHTSSASRAPRQLGT